MLETHLEAATAQHDAMEVTSKESVLLVCRHPGIACENEQATKPTVNEFRCLRGQASTLDYHAIMLRVNSNPVRSHCATDAWKNMPMMAIMARRPLASSADSFLVFSAGSEEVNTLKP